jgi:hypothetical protein
MVVPLNDKCGIRRELFTRLLDPPPGAADVAGEDQRLSLGPAFGQALLDEKLICPPLLGSCHWRNSEWLSQTRRSLKS